MRGDIGRLQQRIERLERKLELVQRTAGLAVRTYVLEDRSVAHSGLVPEAVGEEETDRSAWPTMEEVMERRGVPPRFRDLHAIQKWIDAGESHIEWGYVIERPDHTF